MKSEKRLIDAYTFAEEIESLQITVAGNPARWNDAKHSVLRKIAEQPAIDAVEVVHGRWEDEYEGVYINPKYRCSVCKGRALYRQKENELGSWMMVQALTDYCPHCGAKMDGDENG